MEKSGEQGRNSGSRLTARRYSGVLRGAGGRNQRLADIALGVLWSSLKLRCLHSHARTHLEGEDRLQRKEEVREQVARRHRALEDHLPSVPDSPPTVPLEYA